MRDDKEYPFHVFDRIIETLDRALIWISLLFGGSTLIFMTVFSTWNVLVMRKALNAPILGAEDLLILSLVVIVAFSIPLGSRTGAHIEIEVLEPRMTPGFAKWSKIFVKLLALTLLITMSWQLWKAGESAVRFGEGTRQLYISYEPFYYLLALSIGVFAFVVALDTIQILRSKRTEPIKISEDSL